MIRCPECGHMIEVNGVGPSNSPKFSWFLRTVYSASCEIFHEAGNDHDLHYHMYQYGKKRADRVFLRDMLRAIEKNDCNWLSEKWYRYQAKKFYLAVKLGGDVSYADAQYECLLNLNINSRNIR